MLVNSPGKSRDIQEHLESVFTLGLVSLGLVTVFAPSLLTDLKIFGKFGMMLTIAIASHLTEPRTSCIVNRQMGRVQISVSDSTADRLCFC